MSSVWPATLPEIASKDLTVACIKHQVSHLLSFVFFFLFFFLVLIYKRECMLIYESFFCIDVHTTCSVLAREKLVCTHTARTGKDCVDIICNIWHIFLFLMCLCSLWVHENKHIVFRRMVWTLVVILFVELFCEPCFFCFFFGYVVSFVWNCKLVFLAGVVVGLVLETRT